MTPPPPGATRADAATEIAGIRTLALLGAAGAGKTSLAEALLHRAGMLAAPGSVERGSTVSDHDPVERRRGHSLSASVLHLSYAGLRVHLVDTPGSPDFLGQALPALEAVETAVVVIDAVTGITPTTQRMMDEAAARGRDRLLVVNRIDAAGADLPGLLVQLQAAFGRACLPLNLPAERGARVVDCFHGREGASDFGSVAAAHRALVEQVVEVDAAFVERYLEDGDVDPAELHAPLEQALREGHLVPVCFTSARTGAGVAELLQVVERLLPNPLEANPPRFLRGLPPPPGGTLQGAEDATPVEVRPDPAAPVLAHVFRVTVDPYVGRLGVMRVHQGTVTRDSQLFVGDGRRPFRVAHLYRLQGKDHVEIERAVPGDLCAVAKVDAVQYDAVLHDAAEDEALHLAPLALPRPVHGLALAPRRRGDEQRMAELLQRMVDEDPCLRVEHPEGGHETVVYGLGELHVRVLLERLREVHRFEVDTRPPRIAYRETVTAAAAGHHRHKKQTGGAGQFGEVFLRVEPLPRSSRGGAGYEFVDAVKGGTIPQAFIPAVEKGVREALAAGAVAGYPVVDVRVTVHDGKHHSVDSKEIAFVTAARKATLAALREARPIVLEPVVHLEVTAPADAVGDVTGDIAARRGSVLGTRDGPAGTLVVRALAPLAELQAWQVRLNALTGGQGRYTVELSHLDPVPPTVQQRLAAERTAHDDTD